MRLARMAVDYRFWNWPPPRASHPGPSNTLGTSDTKRPHQMPASIGLFSRPIFQTVQVAFDALFGTALRLYDLSIQVRGTYPSAFTSLVYQLPS
jgi:hypothetical protein